MLTSSSIVSTTSFLSQPNVVAASGFLHGLVYGIPLNSLLFEYPLSSLLRGSFWGMVQAMGACLISEFLPQDFHCAISGLCLAGSAYRVISRLSPRGEHHS